MRTYFFHAVVSVLPVAAIVSAVFCGAISRQKRCQTLTVLPLPAFHMCVAAALPAHAFPPVIPLWR